MPPNSGDFCCVSSCPNNSRTVTRSKSISFFPFPDHPQIRIMWMQAILKPNHFKVCSSHFHHDDLVQPDSSGAAVKLQKDAIPVFCLPQVAPTKGNVPSSPADSSTPNSAAAATCMIQHQAAEHESDPAGDEEADMHIVKEDNISVDGADHTYAADLSAPTISPEEVNKSAQLDAGSKREDLTCQPNKPVSTSSSHELAWLCRKCQKRFRQSDSLRMHLSTAHNIIVWPCETCKKQFQTEGKLKFHQTVCTKATESEVTLNTPDNSQPISAKITYEQMKRGKRHSATDGVHSAKTTAVEAAEVTLPSDTTTVITRQPDKQIQPVTYTDDQLHMESSHSIEDDTSVRHFPEPTDSSREVLQEVKIRVVVRPESKPNPAIRRVSESQLTNDVKARIFATYLERLSQSCATQPQLIPIEPQSRRVQPESPALTIPHLDEKSDASPGVFQCEKCGKTVASKRGWQRHKTKACPMVKSPRYNCEACNDGFQRKPHLLDHCRKQHPERLFRCKCGKGFLTTHSLQKHQETHRRKQCGTKPLFICEVCGKTYTVKQNLMYHRTVHTGENLCSCDICGKPFRHPGVLRMHKRVHHGGERRHKCDLCDKAFLVKSKLRVHRYIHTGEKPKVCKVCGKGFRLVGLLSRHMQIHTGVKPFECGTCGRRFSQKVGLQMHQAVHTGAKPYVCDTCGKRYLTRTALRYHMISHDRVKQCVCGMCGKCFSSDTRLKMHQRKHLFRPRRPVCKPEACTMCGKVLSSRYSLANHMRLHTGERPYVCNVCGKAYTSKVPRDIHELRHAHKRPYKCDRCDASFYRRVQLTEHHTLHTGAKPYQCNSCGKAYRCYSSLACHRKTSHSEASLKCDECCKTFWYPSHLAKHKLLMHKYQETN